MKIAISLFMCVICLQLLGQGEYLPHTFSSANISANYHITQGLTSYGVRIGYTNKKTFAFSVGGVYSNIVNNTAYEDISEVYLVPRLELYSGENFITRLGAEYGFGKATGNTIISDNLEEEGKVYAAGDLSFSLALGSRKGIAIFPTLSARLTNRKYEMGGTQYFTNTRELLLEDFYEDLSVSLPLLFNFESAQFVVVPKMGRSIYGTYYEAGVSINLYHSARCKVVRHQIKKNDVLSRFYN